MDIFNRKEYFSDNELYFSTLRGNGIYCRTGRQMKMPENLQKDKPECPVFAKFDTGEEFFARAFYPVHREAMKSLVMEQVPSDLILWPVDIISSAKGEVAICQNMVETVYDFESTSEEVTAHRMEALLFRTNACIAGISLRDFLRAHQSKKRLSYENSEVLFAAKCILRGFVMLNKRGFLYLDVDLDKLHLVEEHLYFDFSGLIFRTPNQIEARRTQSVIRRPWIAPEFAEPALVKGIISEPDYRAQNYAIAALLFYMFFGVHAYEGKLLYGYNEDSENEYFEKYRVYHNMDIFVFDEHDHSNSIGVFTHEDEIINLWEKAPKAVKITFQRALSTENAERKCARDQNLSPEKWLQLIEYVWSDGYGE